MKTRQYLRLWTRALNGHAESAWILGEAFLDGVAYLSNGERFYVAKSRIKAIRWLRYAALLNHTDAMLELAMVISSSGQFNDIQMALNLEVRAYHLGNRFAAYNAALSYAMLDQPDNCFLWLCKGKRTETRLAMAYCYSFGYGTRKNVKKAKALLKALVNDTSSFQSERESATSFLRLLNTTSARHLRRPPNSNPAFPLGRKGVNESLGQG